MTRLAELLRQLTPGDVASKPLGDVGEFVRGSGLLKADLTDVGAPAIHYGQIHTHYGAWAESTKSFVEPALAARLRRAKPGDLVIATTSEDDASVAKATAWLGSSEVAVSGDAYIYRHNLDPKYVSYFFQSELFRAQKQRHITGAKVRRISGDALAIISIAIPPREVQEEIVRILAEFEAAIGELAQALSHESELRLGQHHLCREVMLERGDEATIDGALRLGDLVDFSNGKPHERLVNATGTVALLTARFISTSGKSARWVNAADTLSPAIVGDIALVMSDLPKGRALARCFYVEEDGRFSANQRVCLLRVRDPQRASARWLYHFLDRNPQLLVYDNGQDQTHLKKGQILGIQVPPITLAKQERIAATLDELDTSMRDLAVSLKEERDARLTQYGHFRNRVLTFAEGAG